MPSAGEDTEELLKRVAGGERAAEGQLLERHPERLRDMIALRRGGRTVNGDAAIGSAATQEVRAERRTNIKRAKRHATYPSCGCLAHWLPTFGSRSAGNMSRRACL